MHESYEKDMALALEGVTFVFKETFCIHQVHYMQLHKDAGRHVRDFLRSQRNSKTICDSNTAGFTLPIK